MLDLDLVSFLSSQNLAHYCSAFISRGIDGNMLLELSQNDLQHIIPKVVDRKKLIKALSAEKYLRFGSSQTNNNNVNTSVVSNISVYSPEKRGYESFSPNRNSAIEKRRMENILSPIVHSAENHNISRSAIISVQTPPVSRLPVLSDSSLKMTLSPLKGRFWNNISSSNNDRESEVWLQMEKKFGESTPTHCRFCKTLLELKSVASHELHCNHRPIECRHCHSIVAAYMSEDVECRWCKGKWKQDRVEEHEQECEEREVNCGFCGEGMKKKEMAFHVKNCDLVTEECEACGEKVLEGEMPLHLMEMCNKRTTLCPFPGCINEVLVDQIQEHKSICAFRPMVCKNDSCPFQGIANEIEYHMKHECVFRKVPCQHCNKLWLIGDIKPHEAECDHRIVPCKYIGCTFSGEIATIASHEARCGHRPARCKYCSNEFEVDMYSDHITTCPQRFRECPHCSRTDIYVEEIEGHIEKCPARVVACPYPGCTSRNLKLAELSAHKKKCVHRPHPCPHCKQEMPLSAIDTHIVSCPSAGVPCPHCDFVVLPGLGKNALKNHLKNDCKLIPEECPNGCGTTLPRSQMQTHLKSGCTHKPRTCGYCGLEFDHDELEDHVATECEFAPTNCELCGESITRKDIETHSETLCTKRKVTCPSAGCNQSFAAADLPRHIEECEFRILTCPRCSAGGLRKAEYLEHLKSSCPERDTSCPHCGTGGLLISNLEFHLRGCEKVPLKCDQCGTEIIGTSNLAIHRADECPKRTIECEFCPAHDIPVDKYKEHLADACPAAPMECEKCKLVFRGKKRLAEHQCAGPVDSARRQPAAALLRQQSSGVASPLPVLAKQDSFSKKLPIHVGMTISAFSEGRVEIKEVTAGGPAERAGLRAGDCIISVGGVPAQSHTVFWDYLKEAGPGATVAVVVWNGLDEVPRKTLFLSIADAKQ